MFWIRMMCTAYLIYGCVVGSKLALAIFLILSALAIETYY